MFNTAKITIAGTPIFKTLIGVFSLLIAGILSGTFVTEITVDGQLQWKLFYKAWSLYFLVGFTFLMYLYFKFLLSLDESINNFKDDMYCKAYMRKQCLPELARRTNELIQTGKDTDELKDIIKDLNL